MAASARRRSTRGGLSDVGFDGRTMGARRIDELSGARRAGLRSHGTAAHSRAICSTSRLPGLDEEARATLTGRSCACASSAASR